ncbi:hypothetical protein FJZ19_02455 [Candidatus Pacearchaeota archaeon]|nr:hypothetical protein [Candidatus Pacearchaeota archaeon]
MTGLEFIAKQEYPGRGILIGRTLDGKDFVAYFVTGRSPPSRARRLEDEWESEDRVRTSCIDPEAIKKGTPELLIYNAMQLAGDFFIVSNGAQTDIIAETIKGADKRGREAYEKHPVAALMDAHANPVWVRAMKDGKFTGEYIDLTSFEPDAPNFTPRISGVLSLNKAAISIVKNNNDLPQRNYFEFPLVQGRAKYVSTYTGQNVPDGQIIPCFTGEPLDVELWTFNSAQLAVDDIYNVLGPKQPGEGIISPEKDFRVGVSAIQLRRFPRAVIDRATKNYHEKPVR